ncbi:hypothetical protein SALBM135S_03016 [Streptomyces alboniger]
MGYSVFVAPAHPGTRAERHPFIASVTSLTASVHQRLADALSAALPEAGAADPLLRRSDRADFQANGILALAKKAKANPRELATQVVEKITNGDLLADVEAWVPAS